MKEKEISYAARVRTIIYWITTSIIGLETAVGAAWDIGKIPFVTQVMAHLGYPSYFLVLMGVWKTLAVPALLLPRLPRLKEWAYAGVFFVYTGAAVSHFIIDTVAAAWGPLIFAGLTLISWAFRPASRRLSVHS